MRKFSFLAFVYLLILFAFIIFLCLIGTLAEDEGTGTSFITR